MNALNPIALDPTRSAGADDPCGIECRERTLSWQSTDRFGQARRLSVSYRMHGPLHAPLRVVLGGVSASRQVQCWWRAHYGAGRALDPARVRILGMDWLDHPTGISTHDQADALARVLDDLRIDSIDVLIGASYGAMVGLAFAQRHGHRLRRLVAIAGADRARPAAQALRQIQRAFLDLGDELGQPERGVAWARALALTAYRPAALFDQRFAGESPAGVAKSLNDYLEHQGRRYGRDVSPARYRCLSKSIDEHQAVPALIRCPVDLIGVDSDTLVPLDQLEALRSRLGGPSRLHVISSAYGHDAFLKEDIKLKSLLELVCEKEIGHE